MKRAAVAEPIAPSRNRVIGGVRAAATYIGISAKRLRQLTAIGTIPHFREGGLLYYRAADLDAWVEFAIAKTSLPQVAPTPQVERQPDPHCRLVLPAKRELS